MTVVCSSGTILLVLESHGRVSGPEFFGLVSQEKRASDEGYNRQVMPLVRRSLEEKSRLDASH